MFDTATMQRRFHDLGRQRDSILAQSGPLRSERDQALANIEARVKALETTIKELEEPLFEIDRERAFIARALNGKTGVPQ
jgi:hypothetical protein